MTTDTTIKRLRINDTWSIEYDEDDNDRPTWWWRYGKPHSKVKMNNPCLAMFYRLLELEQS